MNVANLLTYTELEWLAAQDVSQALLYRMLLQMVLPNDQVSKSLIDDAITSSLQVCSSSKEGQTDAYSFRP